MKVAIYFILLILLYSSTNVYAETNQDKLKKIKDQLISVENLYNNEVLDKASYESTKERLITKRSEIEKLIEQSKNSNTKTANVSGVLQDQLKIIEKLFKDGVLSEEEYLKTKKFLEDKEEAGTNILEYDAPDLPTFSLNIKKDPGKRGWEKAEIVFKNYKIVTYRPGGIKVVRISDNKTLLRISDNFKHKYYNNGESVIEIKKTEYSPPTAEEDIQRQVKELKDFLEGNWGKKKAVWDKEAHKLELFIEGTKILHYEGRFVNKHKAYFYQVLTSNFQPFHFYIKLRGRTAIALNMEFFNMKIDRAVRKVKKELAAEYDITEEQIEQIVNKKIGEEADKAIQEGIESAISESVQEAIAQSIGQAMSQGVIDAIEAATGEAIAQALEDELAKHIDDEIQRAIQQGIEEAAVAAGFQAYYDTLLAGGSIQEALDAAGEACGDGCEFELK